MYPLGYVECSSPERIRPRCVKERMDGHDEGLTCGDWFFCAKEIAADRVEATSGQRARRERLSFTRVVELAECRVGARTVDGGRSAISPRQRRRRSARRAGDRRARGLRSPEAPDGPDPRTRRCPMSPPGRLQVRVRGCRASPDRWAAARDRRPPCSPGCLPQHARLPSRAAAPTGRAWLPRWHCPRDATARP